MTFLSLFLSYMHLQGFDKSSRKAATISLKASVFLLSLKEIRVFSSILFNLGTKGHLYLGPLLLERDFLDGTYGKRFEPSRDPNMNNYKEKLLNFNL